MAPRDTSAVARLSPLSRASATEGKDGRAAPRLGSVAPAAGAGSRPGRRSPALPSPARGGRRRLVRRRPTRALGVGAAHLRHGLARRASAGRRRPVGTVLSAPPSGRRGPTRAQGLAVASRSCCTSASPRAAPSRSAPSRSRKRERGDGKGDAGSSRGLRGRGAETRAPGTGAAWDARPQSPETAREPSAPRRRPCRVRHPTPPTSTEASPKPPPPSLLPEHLIQRE